MSVSGSEPCVGEHDCQQICVNNDDSYVCICEVGYKLNADKKTCSSKSDGLSWYSPTYYVHNKCVWLRKVKDLEHLAKPKYFFSDC